MYRSRSADSEWERKVLTTLQFTDFNNQVYQISTSTHKTCILDESDELVEQHPVRATDSNNDDPASFISPPVNQNGHRLTSFSYLYSFKNRPFTHYYLYEYFVSYGLFKFPIAFTM